MYRYHFGLKYPPVGKEIDELWDDGTLALLKERFQWLLDSPGIGLLTGEAGVGKTAALRNPPPPSIPTAIRSSIWPRPTSGAWTCTAAWRWP